MSLVRFAARNHPQQVTSSQVDDRATTGEVFGPLHARFGFTIDVAASAANTKCARYHDVTADGLAQSWAAESVWCNPPYSSIDPWVRKAWAEYRAAVAVVMLLPANRTEQSWWQQLVEPYRDRPGSALRSEFLAGRIRFLSPVQASIGPNERPPFGSVLLIWQRTEFIDPQGQMSLPRSGRSS